MELGLHLGAFAPPVSEQIKEQLNYTDDEILKFDAIAHSLVGIYLAGIITAGENAKARKRLMKKITGHLNNSPCLKAH